MNLDWLRSMTPGVALFATAFLAVGFQGPAAQTPSVPTFRSKVDLVRVTAIVRDRKGRFVQALAARDFEVFDGGALRPIVDFGYDSDAISLALLFDASGSMEGRMRDAREAASHVLGWLDASRDEAAIYTFDTHLDEIVPFTVGITRLPQSLSEVTAFGATSLHDAIAQTAERTARREGRRRAVAVFTDGNDNASRLRPQEVSAIASAIDVPVYVFGIVPSIDNPHAEIATGSAFRSPLVGALADLAAWTGGRVLIASVPAERSIAARQMVDELRHQYFIAFESSPAPGWHQVEVRTRDRNLVVRTRSGYSVGQSRPETF